MNNKTFKFTAVAVVSILAPFVLFSSALKHWETGNPIAGVMQTLFYPIEYAVHSFGSNVSELFDTYISNVESAQENRYLKSELDSLKIKLLTHDELSQENERLRKLLSFKQQYRDSLLMAEVVHANRDARFRILRINQGRRTGIKIGMPVIAAGGLVGRVIRVNLFHSDVQIVTDYNFRLDVLLQRTRVRGVLSGSGGESCAIHLRQRANLRIGDTVVSSGIIGAFPKGVPVGSVKKITFNSDDVAQIVTIQPWINFESIEEVAVLMKSDPHIEDIVETAGSQWLDKNSKGKSM